MEHFSIFFVDETNAALYDAFDASMGQSSTLENNAASMDSISPPAYLAIASETTTVQICSWLKPEIPTDAGIPLTAYELLRRETVPILNMKLFWSAQAFHRAFRPRLYRNCPCSTRRTRATSLAKLPILGMLDIFLNAPLQLIQAARTGVEDRRAKRKAREYMVNQIRSGLSIRLESTLKVMRDLRLATPRILDGETRRDEILNILQSHEPDEDGEILLTVTFLVTAFASRFLPKDVICLVPWEIFPRIFCHSSFFKEFDLIERLKVDPVLANISPQGIDAVPTVEYYLRKLVPALKDSATEANDIPLQLRQLLPTLRQIKLLVGRRVKDWIF